MGVENGASDANPRRKSFTSRTDLIELKDSTITLNDEPPKEIIKTGWRNYAGIIFTILTSITCVLSSLMSKALIQRNYHPVIAAIWRCPAIMILTPLLIVYLRVKKDQNVFEGIMANKGRTFILLLIRGTIGFFTMCFYIYSLQYITLADTTVIFFSTPIAVFLFARIFLAEPCGLVPVFAALVTLAGVAVLTRPPLLTGEEDFDQETLTGIALALGAMLGLTIIFLVTRHLRKVHYSLPLLSFAYISFIEGMIFLFALGIFEWPRTSEDWLLGVGAAFIEILVQLFLVLSLKFEAAGPVAMIRTLDIVFTFILQILFFGLFPDVFSIVGASVIMLGILATTFRKWLSTLPEENSARKRYSFMLK